MFLILVQIISVNLFIYAYGMIQDTAIKNDVTYDAQCRFSVRLLEKDRGTGSYIYDESYQFKNIKEKLTALEKDRGKEISYLRLYLTEEAALTEESRKPMVVFGSYVPNREAYKLLSQEGSLLFTWEENCNGVGCLIANSSMTLDSAERDESTGELFLQFCGEKYRVERNPVAAGIQMTFRDIPEAAVVMAMDIEWMAPPASAKEEAEISDTLQELFGVNEEKLHLPYRFDDLVSKSYFILTIAINLCVCVIILLNSLMIYQYMLEERKQWIAVMHLNGWSMKRLVWLIFAEMLLVMTVCALVSVAIYHTITFPLVAKEHLLGEIVYQSRTYFYSWLGYFAIMVFGCFSCAFSVVRKCRKKLIAYLEERHVWES